MATPSQSQLRELLIWGQAAGPNAKGQEAMNREFERRNPNVTLKVLSLGLDQKLLAAIVGGVPPDVVLQDRFTIAEWASRGAFRPLDDLLARDSDSPNKADYYPAAWNESAYQGKTYAIPQEADDRALYWNRALFRERGIELRAAGLDPDRAPKTWDELLAYSRVLTQMDARGNLRIAGFMPNFGNVWLYLYAVQASGAFTTPDGERATLATPANERALGFMLRGYEIVGGYEKARGFESGFAGSQDNPFLRGKLAMMIDGDWRLNEISRFAPDLDFAVAPPPMPEAGQAPTTWSGGHALAIPTGARNLHDAWEYIKFISSAQGKLIEARAQARFEWSLGRQFIPKMWANRQATEGIFSEFQPQNARYAEALHIHRELLATARTRPISPVGKLLWDEHARAMDAALYGKLSPHEALARADAVVQHRLDERKQINRLPLADASPILVAMAAIIAVVFLARKQKLNPLSHAESRWAFAFLTPWIIGFLALTLGPMLVSLYWSFTAYSVLDQPRWTGLANYREMVGADGPIMYKAFFNTAYVAGFGVPLAIATSISIAMLLNLPVKGLRFYRTAFFMPAVVSALASAMLWGWILMPDPSLGLLNGLWSETLTKWIGAPPPGWMASESWAKHTLIIIGMWSAGGGILFWLAGLKGIPRQLYEQAATDGASAWQQFRRITIPRLTPMIFFASVVGFIGALQEFDRVYVLKGNEGPIGPADALLTPSYRLFDVGYGQFRLGYASAIAWTVFLLVLLVTAAQFWIAPRWVSYDSD